MHRSLGIPSDYATARGLKPQREARRLVSIGRALDLGSPEHTALDEHFARTAAFRWLRRRAGEFGFYLSFPRRNPHGIAYEPWHWCWQFNS